MKLKKMLIALPALLPSGAIHVVVNLADILRTQGYLIDIVSILDGYMRQSFEKMGFPVMIEDVADQAFLMRVADDYDEVLANTLQMYELVSGLSGKNIKVKWWIHEPPAFFRYYSPQMPTGLWDDMGENIELYAAGYVVSDYIRNTYGIESRLLNFGLKDMAQSVQTGRYDIVSPDKITFLLPSLAIQPIKGYDILVLAALALPEAYAVRTEFILMGLVPEENRDYYNDIKSLAEGKDYIKIIDDAVERGHMLSLMKQADCIVAPSREDTTNACMVEGLMLSKLCICSDAAGVSRYMEDCVNGFVFSIEKVEELCARIMMVVDNFDRLGVVAQNGRKIYEEQYSMQVFEKNVEKYWRGE